MSTAIKFIGPFPKKNIFLFWRKIQKGDGDNECWGWLGSKDRDGYGNFWTGSRAIRAHAFSFVLHGGVVLEGQLVRHVVCRNPSCCNPNHLAVGSPKDNSEDMVKDGTQAKGDQNGSRLHPEKLKRGDNHPLKLKPWLIKKGNEHWVRKNPGAILKMARGEKSGSSHLKDSEVIEIRRLYLEDGRTQKEIAALFQVNQGHIGKILRGELWAHLLPEGFTYTKKYRKRQQ